MISNSRKLLSALALTLSALTLAPSPCASAQIIAKAKELKDVKVQVEI